MERRRRRTAALLRWPEAEGRGDVLAGLPGTLYLAFVRFSDEYLKTLLLVLSSSSDCWPLSI